MRTFSRAFAVLAGLLSLLVVTAAAAAASPHFIGTPTATRVRQRADRELQSRRPG